MDSTQLHPSGIADHEFHRSLGIGKIGIEFRPSAAHNLGDGQSRQQTVHEDQHVQQIGRPPAAIAKHPHHQREVILARPLKNDFLGMPILGVSAGHDDLDRSQIDLILIMRPHTVDEVGHAVLQ